MANVFKVALPGYNALTDGDPDHFALFVDQNTDYVLIKEKLASTITSSGTITIAHNLGYVPFCLVFEQLADGSWRKMYSSAIDGAGINFEVDATNITIYAGGSEKTFSYHIFYDKIE